MAGLVGAALLLAIVAVVLAVRAARRRRRDEIRSIHHYHDRLDTLHVVPHDRGGSLKMVEEDDVELPPAHEVDRPRLDPSSAHLDVWSPPPKARPRRSRHDQEWAMRRMQPRARVDTGTIIVVAIVVGVVVAIALAGFLIERGRTTATSTTTTTASSTTTTTPASTRLTASSVTGGLAVYQLPPGAYVLTVTAVGGREWLQLTVPPLSANITTKVLAAGAAYTTSVTGPSDLELGAPSAARVAVSGTPVVLPATFTPPLTLRLVPARGAT